SLTGTDAGNYTLSSVGTTTANITPATLIYNSDPTHRTYGSTNPQLTGTVTGFVNGETLASATSGVLAFSAPATSTALPGEYAVNGSGLTADNGNYVFRQAPENSAALTITPAAITVTIDNVSRFINQPNPQFSLTYSGPSIPGLTIPSLMAGVTFQTNAKPNSPAGTYQINGVGKIAGLDIKVKPGVLTVIDNSPKILPTPVATQSPSAAAPASSTAAAQAPVQENTIGNFNVTYSVDWAKVLENNLRQFKPLAESSFFTAPPPSTHTGAQESNSRVSP
ncbi:MAG: hypothetical protein JOZ62_12910, partial [Acidobacteriaceae bacterium]|nr:hypothetical protein [Acidobacteriaceae bacterium]